MDCSVLALLGVQTKMGYSKMCELLCHLGCPCVHFLIVQYLSCTYSKLCTLMSSHREGPEPFCPLKWPFTVCIFHWSFLLALKWWDGFCSVGRCVCKCACVCVLCLNGTLHSLLRYENLTVLILHPHSCSDSASPCIATDVPIIQSIPSPMEFPSSKLPDWTKLCILFWSPSPWSLKWLSSSLYQSASHWYTHLELYMLPVDRLGFFIGIMLGVSIIH